MRRLAALLALAAGLTQAADWRVQVGDPEQWRALLGSLGLEATAEAAQFRIVVGDSEQARAAGFAPTAETVRVAALQDARDRELEIFWEEPLELPVYTLPAGARVFTKEKRTGAPLMAGVAGDGAGVLWLAAPPGKGGIERFPYIPHALLDLGLAAPFRNARTWAFLDYAYRLRADPEYLARRWREGGIAGLHVSGWPFFEPDAARDAWLETLLAACRREGIVAYCWLELPHVSDRFWDSNPDCREQTAMLQDAQLDWRKLVDLVDPGCASQVEEGLRALLGRFRWDGVNLAELYFESLHGPGNPARFTPMSQAVREKAARPLGFDPLALFDELSPVFWSHNTTAWERFVDFRAGLALTLQERYLRFVRGVLPGAGLIVTQIDDRFDDRMRPFLGADTAALLPIVEEVDATLLIEDPAPLWSLGPERYPEIARRYAEIGADPARLAIDINIVERYQQVYPTRRQVGGELLRLVSEAGAAFPRVALYFERSIGAPDLPLLTRVSPGARVIERDGPSLTVESPRAVGLAWAGGMALVDGGAGGRAAAGEGAAAQRRSGARGGPRPIGAAALPILGDGLRVARPQTGGGGGGRRTPGRGARARARPLAVGLAARRARSRNSLLNSVTIRRRWKSRSRRGSRKNRFPTGCSFASETSQRSAAWKPTCCATGRRSSPTSSRARAPTASANTGARTWS
jgi:hypothetical protein